MVLNKPASEYSEEDRAHWFWTYGCQLGRRCPNGYCVHIQGVAGLDVEYFGKLLEDLNTRYNLGLSLNDIPDLEVPSFMKVMSNLWVLRCAGDQ